MILAKVSFCFKDRFFFDKFVVFLVRKDAGLIRLDLGLRSSV